MSEKTMARKLRNMSEFYAAAVWDQINAKGASIVPEDICEAFVSGFDVGQDEMREEIEELKEVVKDLKKALEFYANKKSYSLTTHQRPRIGLSQRLIKKKDCEQMDFVTNDRETGIEINVFPVAGKLARKTLKENTDKIKAILEKIGSDE